MRGKSHPSFYALIALTVVNTEPAWSVECGVVSHPEFISLKQRNIYLIFWNISQCVNLDKIMLKLLSVQFESIEAWLER